MPHLSTWLSIVALVLAIVALAVSLVGVRSGRTRRVRAARRSARRLRQPSPGAAPAGGDGLAAEVDELRQDAVTALRHVAVVRYDAFGDMGGHLSWSLALLDDNGDGAVLTSIHGRSDARTYAKNIRGWASAQELSPEEDEAISFARDER